MHNVPKINTAVARIIDANYNRAKEGLRVCEEICRFIMADRALTKAFKAIRHDLDGLTAPLASSQELLTSRDSRRDVGRELHHTQELIRNNCYDIFRANMQRLTESLRVLEEFSKLKNASLARGFKSLRYRTYALEKKAVEKFTALRHPR